MDITSTTDIANTVIKTKELRIMQQLSWLVERGILVIEEQPGQFLYSPDHNHVEWVQEITLSVKDKAYIEKLELENKRLKQMIDAFKEALDVT